MKVVSNCVVMYTNRVTVLRKVLAIDFARHNNVSQYYVSVPYIIFQSMVTYFSLRQMAQVPLGICFICLQWITLLSTVNDISVCQQMTRLSESFRCVSVSSPKRTSIGSYDHFLCLFEDCSDKLEPSIVYKWFLNGFV